MHTQSLADTGCECLPTNKVEAAPPAATNALTPTHTNLASRHTRAFKLPLKKKLGRKCNGYDFQATELRPLPPTYDCRPPPSPSYAPGSHARRPLGLQVTRLPLSPTNTYTPAYGLAGSLGVAGGTLGEAGPAEGAGADMDWRTPAITTPMGG